MALRATLCPKIWAFGVRAKSCLSWINMLHPHLSSHSLLPMSCTDYWLFVSHLCVCVSCPFWENWSLTSFCLTGRRPTDSLGSNSSPRADQWSSAQHWDGKERKGSIVSEQSLHHHTLSASSSYIIRVRGKIICLNIIFLTCFPT